MRPFVFLKANKNKNNSTNVCGLSETRQANDHYKN